MEEETPRTNKLCMKLVVPHTGDLPAADARLIRLAQFLGIRCESVRLDKPVRQYAEFIANAVPDRNSCLVVNPQVMREWVGGDVFPADLAACFGSRFPHLLVHGLTLGPFVDGMISSLSKGRLRSVKPIADAGRLYEISPNSQDICGHFSGLSFGPINPANDHALTVSTDDSILAGLVEEDPYLHIVGPNMATQPYGIGINLDNTGLVRFVNGTLERIRRDGTWNTLYRKWLTVLGPAPMPPTPRYLD